MPAIQSFYLSGLLVPGGVLGLHFTSLPDSTRAVLGNLNGTVQQAIAMSCPPLLLLPNSYVLHNISRQVFTDVLIAVVLDYLGRHDIDSISLNDLRRCRSC